MKLNVLQRKRALRSVLLILLLGVAWMTNGNAQTPYRQYADNGVLLNFHEIDNVDFRVFLLYNLRQDDQFILTENEEFGQFSINPNEEEDNLAFYDAFETFYQNIYTDFQLLTKMDISEQLPQWKSQVAPQHFTSIMMDVTLRRTRSVDNNHCIDAVKICTSDITEYEAAITTLTADDLEPYPIEDGCIGSSYNPSWYYLRIADPGQFIIHMEGYDPDNGTQRDIDFCLWGPYTEDQVNSGYACSHLTTNMIIDCSYSVSYIENAYLGYLDNQHNHNSTGNTGGHGTVNYHEPQTGEYYFLMITNFSRQPCVVTFTKEEGSGSGTADCSLLPPIVSNDGPYCVGETIQLYAIGATGASYQWNGPNNYRSRYQNPNRPNCTMAMAGPYICTITRNGQTASDTTWVEVYPNVNADFTATNVDVGQATQFNSTSTTTPPEYTDSIPSFKWDFGDGYTGSGATSSHYYGQAGSYQVTLTVTTGGHCTDEITQTVTVNLNPTGIIPFADANVKALCVAYWDTNGDGELSYAEAVAVTSLGEVFKNNSNITSFNELRYFIGLTSIGNNAFNNCFNLTSIEFPSSLTAIGESAFYYCYNLTAIEMPGSLVSIGNYAFYYCYKLTSIEIPNAVTSIGDYAFYHCNRVSTLSLSNSLSTIGNYAFQYCSGLTSIELPNAVTSIGDYAFSNCSGMTSIELPNSLTSIGNRSFSSCSGLISIEIPYSVNSIGTNPFSECPNLEQIVVDSRNTYYDSRAYCNAIIHTSTNTLVTGCKNTVIPNAVRSIGSYAFSYCTGLTSVEIPNSMTSIGNYAFYNCTGLTLITLPNTVSSIGSNAFRYCTGLTSIEFPNPVTEIGDYAFSYCTGLTSIVLPDSITSISNYSFSNCSSLVSIEIPSTVTTIGSYAFNYCSGLTSIVSWTETPPALGSSVFYNVNKTIPVYVPFGTVATYQSAYGWNEFTNIQDIGPLPISFADANVKVLCVAHWDTNGDGELSYNEAAAVTDLGEVFQNNITITSFDELQYFTGLTSINDQAFYNCTKLSSITIPNSVTSIGIYAFYYCNRLTSITIPNSVTSIGSSAFSNCTGLTSIEIPNSVTSLGASAFYMCSGLISIEIPNSVTLIGSRAFGDCIGLTSIEIPNSVTSIGNWAFSNCRGLTSIEIPNSVSSMGTNPFEACTGLEQIVVASGNTYYDSRENCNAIIHTSNNSLVTGCKNTVIQSSVTKIGDDAFFGCAGLTSMEIPNSVTTIGGDAFFGCAGLTSMEIPNSVTTIGGGAFSLCSALRLLNILAETPPSMGSNVFYNVSPAIPVYVPCDAVENYQEAYGWNGFNNYIGLCSGMVSVEVNPTDGGTVIGDGDFYAGDVCVLTATPNEDYVFGNWTENGMVVSDNPIFSFRAHPTTMVANFCSNNPIVFADANVKALCVANWDTNSDGELSYAEAAAVTDLGSVFKNKSSITSFNELQYFIKLNTIGNEAFYYCTNLTSIVIPNSVISIGNYAFRSCTRLTSMAIPNSVTSIGSEAFHSCSGLTSVEIPASVTYISSNLFSSCSGLQQITVAVGNNYYDSRGNCNAIIRTSTNTLVTGCKNTVIPSSVTSIGSYAFYGCTELASIEIPSSVASIGSYAFYGCTELASIEIPSSVSSIGSYAFYYCTNLTSIEIPSSVTAIEYKAFYGCTGLASVEIPSSVTYIYDYAFYNCSNLTSMVCLAETPPTWGNHVVFYNVLNTIPVYVPCGTVEAYQTANGWNGFTNIVGLCSGEVSVVVNPSYGGTVTGAGNYNGGDVCVLTATPNQGYVFGYWTENGNEVSTNASYTFIVTGNRNLVAHFCTIVTEETSITECDSYTWFDGNGQTYTSSGDYVWNTTTDDGCPMIVTLHLTINQSDEVTLPAVTECDFYDWEGQHIFSSGTYDHETTTPEGCQRIEHLSVTINHSDEVYFDPVTECDLYVWNGQSITQSGTYDLETTTPEGCQRIEHLSVTINHSDEVYFDPVTACDEYVWNGQSITQSGTYDLETTTPDGCQRIEHLSVTINHSDEVNLDPVTACDVYVWNGQSITQSGTYDHETTTPEGCSRIEHLNVTINYSEDEEYTVTASDSYTWHGQTYTTSGDYQYETTTAQGCPRTEILHLTIEGNHWTPVGEGSYPFSMTLYGVISIDGVEQTNNQLELGVFCGNECRGSAMVTEFFLTNRYLAEVNVYGDSGQELTFKLYDHATNQELDLTPPEAITFTIDGYGNPIDPYVLNFTSSVNITATTAPEGAGMVTGTGEYIMGATCTLTATANMGFQFQNWTLNGTVVSTTPSYTFMVTGAANYVAHFQYVQSRTLVSGWNWWSTYIEQNGSNGLSMLENSLGTSGIRIQGKSNSVDYFEYQGTGYWYGSLNTLANEQMYMIRTSAACDAVIVGNAALPANHPITINGGWNWIGYPSSQNVDVNIAMSGFTPEANDVVKGRNSVSTYISYGSYQGWYGQLNTLEPGQGYMYRSYSTSPKTLTFQTGRGEETLANITSNNNVFVPNTANYADNMIVTAVIDMDGEELRSNDYELAAFVGDECRGSVKLMYVEPFDRYVALLMAFGEGEEELRFVLTDGNGTSWSNDRMTYVANGTVGTMTEPEVLHFGPLGIEDNMQKLVSVYPNPSNGIFNIEGEGIRKIEVIDVYGQVILFKEVKTSNIQVNLRDKAAGAYLLRVVTDGGIVTHKLIKNN